MITLVVLVLLLFVHGIVNGREIKNQHDKSVLIKKMKSKALDGEVEHREKYVTLNYMFRVFQNTIFMAGRSLVEKNTEVKIDQDSHFAFKSAFPKKEVLKRVLDYSSKINNWFIKTYQNDEYFEYLIQNGEMNVLKDTIYIKLKFDKGKFGPEKIDQILIVDRSTLQMLITLDIFHFEEGTFVGAEYSKYLPSSELASHPSPVVNKTIFAQNSEEMESYISKLCKETPRLAVECPWLLEKDKKKVPVELSAAGRGHEP